MFQWAFPRKTAYDSTYGILHNLMQDFNDNGLVLTQPVYVKNTRIYIPTGNDCYSTTITTLPRISKYTKSLGYIYYEEYFGGSGGAPFSISVCSLVIKKMALTMVTI